MRAAGCLPSGPRLADPCVPLCAVRACAATATATASTALLLAHRDPCFPLCAVETGVLCRMLSTAPVSYTHLTLPTICSV
eukprot:1275124-Rhodomonas_salina.3